MNCEQCGRDDGHWLGCDQAGKPYLVVEPGETLIEKLDEDPQGTEPCAFAGCQRLRASAHHSALFCTTHKDPKNRKV